MEKIIYKCKKCNWKASIPAIWEDLKPSNCGNKKCKTSFKKDPETLVAEIEKAKIVEKPVVEIKQENKLQKELKKPQQQFVQQAVKKEEAETQE